MRSDSARQIADQYKPAPGSPYRPVLSPPQQVYELQLGWSDCTITHAFVGIDPPRSLVPAAALVPNLTPTSPQNHGTETTSISFLKSVSGALEAGSIRATRDPPAAPAHKVQTAAPRSTPSPSSSSDVDNDPLKPKTSFNPHHTQTPISPEAVSRNCTSSTKARASSVQRLTNDRSFTSLANTEVSNILSDAFQSSRVSSDQKFDIRSTLSPIAVASDLLPTHEEKYEEGVSIRATGTPRDPSSDDHHGQNGISPNSKTLPSDGSMPQESRYPQGLNTAEPGSPQPETLSDNDLSTRNRGPPYQTKGKLNGPFTHVLDDPSGEPASVSNPAQSPDIGASIASSNHVALQSSPYSPLPNGQEEQQSQTSSPSNVDEGLTPIDMSASKPSPEVKPDPLTSATLTGPKIIPQTKSDPLTFASSIPFEELSDLKSDPLIYSAASMGIRPTNSISGSSTHEATAPANGRVSKQSFNVTADPPPSITIPSSDLHSVPADSNTVGRPQSWPSNSTKAIIGNQMAPAFESSGASAVSRRAGAPSFASKGFRGNSTVLPFKSGEEEKAISCFTSLLVCFCTIFLLIFV